MIFKENVLTAFPVYTHLRDNAAKALPGLHLACLLPFC